MKTYRVTVITEGLGNYMMDGNKYTTARVNIMADNAGDAIKIAERKHGYVINKKDVKTLEELEEERRAENEEIANIAKKRADAAAKRKATEQKKAEELGMTLEEYRFDKWRKGEVKRLKKIIADAEEELKKLGE